MREKPGWPRGIGTQAENSNAAMRIFPSMRADLGVWCEAKLKEIPSSVSDKADARSRSRFPSRGISRLLCSIRYRTCYLLRADSHRCRVRTCHLFRQPLRANLLTLSKLRAIHLLGCHGPMLCRIEGKVKTAIYFNKPESQCTIFSANCRLSMPGRFMPNGI